MILIISTVFPSNVQLPVQAEILDKIGMKIISKAVQQWESQTYMYMYLITKKLCKSVLLSINFLSIYSFSRFFNFYLKLITCNCFGDTTA